MNTCDRLKSNDCNWEALETSRSIFRVDDFDNERRKLPRIVSQRLPERVREREREREREE